MSLIGPRPDPLDDMDIYTEYQKKKLAVRPGITGYNQAYYRNSVEQNEKFEHDVYYAERSVFPCIGYGADYVYWRWLAGSGGWCYTGIEVHHFYAGN